MHLFVLLPLTLFVASIVIPVFKLANNYYTAKKIGLPILLTPISLLGPIWAIVWSLYGGIIEPLLLSLPFSLGSWARYSQHAWFYKNGHYLHSRYGDAFIIITPSDIEVVIADPEVADDLNTRRKEFVKEPGMYEPLEIFGPHVDTLNGEDWQRHRRLTAPPFNERNNKLVWSESLAQADGMLASWMEATASEDKGVNKTVSDTMTLALHVLQGAGFGKSYPFDGGVSKLADGHLMIYQNALRLILHNMFITLFIKWAALMPSFLLPKNINEIKIAVSEFRKYMYEMIESEKNLVHRAESELEQKSNLLSVLVRLSEQEKGTNGKKGLSDEELFGNLFFYNLAGHDTAASTLAYAVTLLAADRKWQAWVREELDVVFTGKDEVEEWEYEKAFPRLKRCLAILHETLRLYGPVPAISKYVENAAVITIKGKQYNLPPKTWIPINHAAIHTHPAHWGSDSQVWRPDRWILTSSKTPSASPSLHSLLASEYLLTPKAGQFLPWTSGPRMCPGKKFAQVEIVAVIARIFRNHEVRPEMLEGETDDQAKERVLDVVRDSIVNMTLQMADPERVKLIWRELEKNKVGKEVEGDKERGVDA